MIRSVYNSVKPYCWTTL